MDDLIRNFFGIGHGSRSNNFNQPPDTDCEDGDDFFHDRNGSFGPRRGGLDDMFEHFHQDMFQQMESLQRQMEEMFKGFGAVDFPSDFSPPSSSPNDAERGRPRNKIFSWSGPSPFFHRSRDDSKKSPRDFMLKDDETETLQPEPAKPKIKQGPVFDMPKLFKYGSQNMEDTDLDGKLSDENVLALIKRPEEGGRDTDVRVQAPQTRPGGFFSRQSVSISTFNGPDGKREQKRVVRDSSGREESSVTRSIGDKSYTVTTVTDDSGAQEKHEKLHNMDEGELSKFEELWSKPKVERPSPLPGDSMLSPRSPRVLPVDPHDHGLFYKLFGGGKS
ncbi:hypothetical protein EGW08_010649 [Elysia chlorotica]|uniref:HCLS1-associated protein X-1 n=1 Tax=Elysia chlorotica TaxID=188477 RepID=A0A3S0ZSF2_ELYCH|nr:hypothetical protein EGW08_010649 [Elysia chlorotica]